MAIDEQLCALEALRLKLPAPDKSAVLEAADTREVTVRNAARWAGDPRIVSHGVMDTW